MTMRRRYRADGSCRKGTDTLTERSMAGVEAREHRNQVAAVIELQVQGICCLWHRRISLTCVALPQRWQP